MNLLINLFDIDKREISNVNKKSVILFLMFVLIIIALVLFTKKNNYYTNEFTMVDNNIVLLVEKEYINTIKNNKKIIINDINFSYSINTISPVNDIYMVDIKLNNAIKNINTGKYKIFLGKESLFDYIVRIIKK